MLRLFPLLAILLFGGCEQVGRAPFPHGAGEPERELAVAPAEGGVEGGAADAPAEDGAEDESPPGFHGFGAAAPPGSEGTGGEGRGDPQRVAEDGVGGVVPAESAAPSSGEGSRAADDAATSPEGLSPQDFPLPDSIRGIYLNAWAAGSPRRQQALLDLARRTELNTFVIDIKDASGFVSHHSQVPLAREVGATGDLRIRNLPALLRLMKDNGIYPIARIVMTKDPVLAEARPDLAIQDSAGGVWLDQNGVTWLNLHSRAVWEYHVDLAREVARMGFPEIQWDYVRFPDAPSAVLGRAVYPGAGGHSKTDAVRTFLGYSRDALRPEGVRVTADVFGVTTSYRRDVGIGQVWESFVDQVDAVLPMVYPSHYWPGSFGFQKPNAYPYEVVRRALRDGMARSDTIPGAASICAWLQDFTLGEPRYGAPEVRAQIQAAYDAGVKDWILWNPGSRYTESALFPAEGLPAWMEPVMRVGGEIVSISRRYEVLGEEGDRSKPHAVPEERGDASVRPCMNELELVEAGVEPALVQ
jgi:hypothetical protein